MPVIILGPGECTVKRRMHWELGGVENGGLIVNLNRLWTAAHRFANYLVLFHKYAPRLPNRTLRCPACHPDSYFHTRGPRTHAGSISPKLVDLLIEWFLLGGTHSRETTGGHPRKGFLWWLSSLWGGRFQRSVPKLMISMFSMTELLCSKMPQEYRNDSFSSKEFWLRNSFLWTRQVHLASILVTVSQGQREVDPADPDYCDEDTLSYLCPYFSWL